jgi:uncharacterized protein (DUF2141 family)
MGREKSTVLCRMVVASVVIAGLSALLPAQTLQSDQQLPAVSGLVLNAKTKEPLSGAVVTIKSAGHDRELITGGLTDKDGTFVIHDLREGQYVITAEKPSFIRLTNRSAAGESLSIASGSGQVNITLELLPTSALAGRILSPDGSPLPGATIQAVQTQLVNGHLRPVVVDRAVSNDLGEYRIFGLRPGNYYIQSFYRDAASVLGLRRRPEKDQNTSEGVTDDFAVTWYPGMLDQRNAQRLRLEPGKNISNIDISIQLTRSVKVEGSLENLPPGMSARVYVEPVDFESAGTRQVFTVNPTNSGNHKFYFRSLPPGEYALRAEIVGSGKLSAYEQFIVAGAPIKDLSLPLQPSPSISGQLVIDDGQQVPDSARLLLEEIDRPLRLAVPILPDGHFVANAISPGAYRVSLSAKAGALFLKSIARDGERLDPLHLKLVRSSTNLWLRATTLAGHIEGVAVNADLSPVKRGIAIATEISGGFDTRSTADVDGSGHFKFASLPPGEYRVMCFSDIRSSEEVTREVLERTTEKGEKITLAADESKFLRLVAVNEDVPGEQTRIGN